MIDVTAQSTPVAIPFDLNGPLTIAILLGPTVRVAAIILAMMYNMYALWLNLRP